VGELRDRLDAVAVEATSPDRNIRVGTHGEASSIDVVFRPGAYRRYRESDLAHQLAQAMTQLFDQYRHAQRNAVHAVYEIVVHGDDSDADPESRQYHQRSSQLAASGEDENGTVMISSQGLVTWQLTISNGTTRRLTEQEFLDDLSAAFHDLLIGYRAQLVLLKDEIYGYGNSPDQRRALGLDTYTKGAWAQ
jgi:hypothetical protein